MFHIGQILYSLVSAVHAFSRLIITAFVLCCTVGQIIIKGLLLIYEWFVSAVTALYIILVILYEDFCLFLVDIGTKLSWSIQLLEYLTACIASFFQRVNFSLVCAVQSVGELFTYFNTCVYDFLFATVVLLDSSVQFMKQSIIVLGSGTWLAIELIPLSVVYAISSIADAFVYASSKTWFSFCHIGYVLVHAVTCAGNSVCNFFVDIPINAYFGLVAGLIIFALALRFRETLIRHGVVVLVFLYQSVTSTLHLGWYHLEQLILHIATNQREHGSDVDVSDSEEEGESIQEERGDDIEDNAAMEGTSGHVILPTLNLRSRPVLRSQLNLTNLSRRQLQRQLEREKEDKLCIVCQDKIKCITLLPCRHLCLCEDCCDVLRQNTGACPMCRHDVRRTLKVYL